MAPLEAFTAVNADEDSDVPYDVQHPPDSPHALSPIRKFLSTQPNPNSVLSVQLAADKGATAPPTMRHSDSGTISPHGGGGAAATLAAREKRAKRLLFQQQQQQQQQPGSSPRSIRGDHQVPEAKALLARLGDWQQPRGLVTRLRASCDGRAVCGGSDNGSGGRLRVGDELRHDDEERSSAPLPTAGQGLSAVPPTTAPASPLRPPLGVRTLRRAPSVDGGSSRAGYTWVALRPSPMAPSAALSQLEGGEDWSGDDTFCSSAKHQRQGGYGGGILLTASQLHEPSVILGSRRRGRHSWSGAGASHHPADAGRGTAATGAACAFGGSGGADGAGCGATGPLPPGVRRVVGHGGLLTSASIKKLMEGRGSGSGYRTSSPGGGTPQQQQQPTSAPVSPLMAARAGISSGSISGMRTSSPGQGTGGGQQSASVPGSPLSHVTMRIATAIEREQVGR